MRKRWGPKGDMPYWAALAAGVVDAAERRAVAMLRSIVDSWRFGIYCATGALPAMGSMTRRLYLVRRDDRVVGLEDGRRDREYCIQQPFWRFAPATDHVAALRCLIEGEEWAFLDSANMFKVGDWPETAEPRPDERTPFERPIAPPASQDPNDFLADIDDVKALRYVAEDAAVMGHTKAILRFFDGRRKKSASPKPGWGVGTADSTNYLTTGETNATGTTAGWVVETRWQPLGPGMAPAVSDELRGQVARQIEENLRRLRGAALH